MPSDVDPGPTWTMLLDQIRRFREETNQCVVGFLPPGIPRSAVAGTALTGQGVAAIVTTTDPWIAVHEILHSAPLGYPIGPGFPWHDPCPIHPSGSDVNPAYERFDSSRETLPLGSIGEVGIDRMGELKLPINTFTILSACNAKWIDPKTYSTILTSDAWLRDSQQGETD